MSERTLVRAMADGRTMIIRSFRLSLRNIDGLITALALPIMLMLMFVYLFGGAIRTDGRYVDYVVPGVLLVCVGFGAATTAISVAADLTSGVIDRFRSMDVPGEALLNGHVGPASPVICSRRCWSSRWPLRSASAPMRTSPTGSEHSASLRSSSWRCPGLLPPSGSPYGRPKRPTG